MQFTHVREIFFSPAGTMKNNLILKRREIPYSAIALRPDAAEVLAMQSNLHKSPRVGILAVLISTFAYESVLNNLAAN